VLRIARPSVRHRLPPTWVRTIQGIAICALLVMSAASVADPAENSASQTADPRDDRSPWGVASGAEWFSDYPIFNPKLSQAGVRWLRGFYEWQTIQPKPGYWNFALPDRLVNNARANQMHLVGLLAYLAPWASADGGTRKFPIKDIQFWRDYVSALVERYHTDIKYWEVWNEFNGSFAEGGTPATYAQLVREASTAAKRIDPTVKIGLSVANFDVNFLDATIKSGAANNFDYICIHPYEILAKLSEGGEPAFLSMATTIRNMLADNHQPQELPLWITEVGSGAPVQRNDALDQAQAVMLAKAYLLAIASGFQRIFWFEARGPSYGNNMDLGLLRADWTPRPSYEMLKTLTNTLGPEPIPAGWLELGDGGYGFLFDTRENAVLAAWSPGKREIKLTFDTDIGVDNLTGEHTAVSAGQPLVLTDRPILITGLSSALIGKASSERRIISLGW
jgi:hypothetical protein